MPQDKISPVTRLTLSLFGQGQIISAPKIFVQALSGDIKTAILFSQIIFWSSTKEAVDGWFYKKYEDWEGEIFLSKNEVARSAKLLADLGVIEVESRPVNTRLTLHYRFSYSGLEKWIDENPILREMYGNDGSLKQNRSPLKQIDGSLNQNSYKEQKNTTEEYCIKTPSIPQKPPAPPSGATQDALFEMDAKSAIPEKPKTKPGTIAEEFNEFDIARGEAARNIHQRHPNRRDLSEAKVYSKLEALSKSLAIKKPDLVSFARRVDDNHRRWCQSDEWTNHDGQYVKSLSAWLNGKAEAEPPRNSTQEPEYHKPVDFYWLRPRDGEEGEGGE